MDFAMKTVTIWRKITEPFEDPVYERITPSEIVCVASEIVSRLPELDRDSPLNNATVIEGIIKRGLEGK